MMDTVNEDLAITSMIKRNGIEKPYDEYCKKILANKQILAYIIKACVKEYADIELEDILPCIESAREINGESNDKIQGDNVEDDAVAGAMIKYDLLFDVSVPYKGTGQDVIRMFINLEGQNKDDPGYPLISRALYYCSRLIAGQKNAPNGFARSEYGKIKKVYSIWICMEHTKKKNDVLNTYTIQEICHGKEWNAPKEHYDMMTAVMVYAGEAADSKQNSDAVEKLQGLLYVLFMAKQTVEEKLEQLNRRYDIRLTRETESEVREMCNFSEGVRNAGIAEGLAKGIAEGRVEGKVEGKAEGKAEGREEATLQYVKNLMQAGNMSITKAMDALGVEEELRSVILHALNYT